MGRTAKIPEGCRLRSDGRLEKRFTYNGHRYSVYGSSKKEIEQNERNLKDEVDQGIVRSVMTLNAYFEKWCAVREADPNIKPATIYTDKRRYKKIAPILGTKKIRDIRKDHIRDMMNQLHAEGVSSKGIKDTLSLLCSIMKDAADIAEIIPKNPCNGLKPPKRSQEEDAALAQKHRYLTPEEIRIFFKYAEESAYYNLFSFLYLTGMRCGEACALTWKDIDEEAGLIHITKTVSRVDDRTFMISTPKTRDSKRDNELTPEIEAVLRKQKVQQVALHGFAAVGGDQLIFTTRKHDLIRQSNISPVIRCICKNATEAGEPIEAFTSHTFRHTYISLEVAKGIPLNVIAKQMGHTNSITLQKHYSHEDPQILHDAFHNTSEDLWRMMQAQ